MADKKRPVKSGKSEDELPSLFGQIMQTREARQCLGNLVPVVFKVWSHKSKTKQWFARMAVPLAEKQFLRNEDVFADSELKALFADERFIRVLADSMTGVTGAMVAALADAGGCLETAATETKKEIMQSVIGGKG